jgi:hypothetical protein
MSDAPPAIVAECPRAGLELPVLADRHLEQLGHLLTDQPARMRSSRNIVGKRPTVHLMTILGSARRRISSTARLG